MEENVPSYSHHAALGLVIALDGPLLNMNTSGKKDFLKYIIFYNFYQSSSFADLSINHVSVCILLVSIHLISAVCLTWSAMLMSVFISLLLPAAGANLATALTSHLRCCVIWSAAVLCAGVWCYVVY